MTQTVVITGANRGIGLALAQAYQQQGNHVLALCRSSSPELEALGVEVFADIDFADPLSIAKTVTRLDGHAIDLLINNAGILSGDSLGAIDYAAMALQFQINALAPLRLTEALRTQLTNGAKVALVTSRMGSMADNSSGGAYGYRMSKAALNAAGVSLSHDLRPLSVAVGIFHPGYVQTDMVGGRGDITASECAARLVQRITELNLDNSGTFWHSSGEILPW